MNNLLLNINSILLKKQLINKIRDDINEKIEELEYGELEYSSEEEEGELSRNIPIQEWRNYVKSNKDLITDNEKLVTITPDGNCEFSAFAVLIYNSEEPRRVRMEIIKHMLKLSFGDKFMGQYKELYNELYNDFIIGKNVPELLTDNIITSIDQTIGEFWRVNLAFEAVSGNELNIQVAKFIADYMKGLPGIDENNPTWGDNIIIPTFAGDLYDISICIHTITYVNSNFIADECYTNIPNWKDNVMRKLVLYHKEFGLGDHFDLIVPENHNGLPDKSKIAQNKLS